MSFYLLSKNMIQIISHTPVYVWILLVYLLRGGWKARQTYTISWKTLCIMPLVMLVWSIYSVLVRYGEIVPICLWAMSTALGIRLGSLMIRSIDLKFDKQQHLVKVSGNWTPLLLSGIIFSLRYFLGATYALHPELIGNTVFLGIENVAT